MLSLKRLFYLQKEWCENGQKKRYPYGLYDLLITTVGRDDDQAGERVWHPPLGINRIQIKWKKWKAVPRKMAQSTGSIDLEGGMVCGRRKDLITGKPHPTCCSNLLIDSI
jgi:hypothetical protein